MTYHLNKKITPEERLLSALDDAIAKLRRAIDLGNINTVLSNAPNSLFHPKKENGVSPHSSVTSANNAAPY